MTMGKPVTLILSSIYVGAETIAFIGYGVSWPGDRNRSVRSSQKHTLNLRKKVWQSQQKC